MALALAWLPYTLIHCTQCPDSLTSMFRCPVADRGLQNLRVADAEAAPASHRDCHGASPDSAPVPQPEDGDCCGFGPMPAASSASDAAPDTPALGPFSSLPAAPFALPAAPAAAPRDDALAVPDRSPPARFLLFRSLLL